MPDKFSNYSDAASHPARKLFAVTPHDSNELADIPKALYVGGAGTLSITAVDDSTPVTLTVVAGAILPIRAKIVRSTGTTATGIVALL